MKKQKSTKYEFCLKEFLVKLGLTQMYTAAKCGISIATIGDMCRNKNAQVRLTTLAKLHDGIGAELGDVVRVK